MIKLSLTVSLFSLLGGLIFGSGWKWSFGPEAGISLFLLYCLGAVWTMVIVAPPRKFEI